MADNVAITSGSGTSIATDQNGSSEHYQLVKIELGDLDQFSGPVSAANPLPITAIALVTSGAAVPSKLFIVGGSDGANARAISLDTAGQVQLSSGGNAGSAVPARTLQVGGSDGTNLRAIKVDTSGVTNVRGTSATAALASVTAVASSTVVVASNANRKGLTLYNDSTANLFLAFASTAATNAFTAKVPPGQYYEMPTFPTYQGVIAGIWDAANGAARVTELT